ncbi:hypothetical protein OZX73_00065 [Bifidobacterium sp. ESL0775]|uniref:hypothetical protein n=1 Tax=Bifidobacterium sp. ESL0775 TaxID=2983230 RepID=UPI0023F9655A|nr:hypothetical protein [Bifidobacterium sp. ESL0775]WEV69340.1 hypothetical protein OZX73_00065 [Bifidobacterium sp. ESL0775]
MKDDSDRFSGAADDGSRPQESDGPSDLGYRSYNVNDLRREESRAGGSRALRQHRGHKSFLFRALIIVVVIAVVAVALVVSLKTFNHNTKNIIAEDPRVSVVQGKTKAPEGDEAQMKQGIEQQTGACTSGWADVDASSQLPGVNAASLCKTTRVAFITFQSKAAASMDGDMVRSQAGNLISQYGGGKVDPKDLRLLSNDLWMAVGGTKPMKTLQQQWGGKLEPIGSSDDE